MIENCERHEDMTPDMAPEIASAGPMIQGRLQPTPGARVVRIDVVAPRAHALSGTGALCFEGESLGELYFN